MTKPWDMPQMQALGKERLRLLREAEEKSRNKTGMERLDIFLEYGEKLAERGGGALPPEEQKALLAAAAAGMPEREREQLAQIMAVMGL